MTAEVNNGTADTCYALLVPCDPRGGGCGIATSATTPLGEYTTATCAAVLVAGNGPAGRIKYGAGRITFSGTLNLDSDTRGAGNAWMLPRWKLMIVGDVGGTAPKLSGCRLYLTYPRKV